MSPHKFLIYAGMAEAYARSFDYLLQNDHILEANKLVRYTSHPKKQFVPGTYTFNTLNMIIAANWIISSKLDERSLAIILKSEVLKRNETYHSKLFLAVEKTYSEKELINSLKSESINNGSLSRALVIGLVKDTQKCIELVKISCNLTKCDEETLEACIALSLLVNCLYYNKSSNIDSWCESGYQFSNYSKFKATNVWNRRICNETYLGLNNVSTNELVILHQSLKDDLECESALKKYISFGGNISEVSSLYWAIKCLNSKDEDLNISWFFENCFELNNNVTGKDYLESVGVQLLKVIGN